MSTDGPNLSALDALGRVYQRDFGIPRSVEPEQSAIDLSCYVIKFAEFAFVKAHQRDKLVHTSESFKHDGKYTAMIVSPKENEYSSFVILKKDCQEHILSNKDMIVEYWAGSRNKPPVADRATLIPITALPYHMEKILKSDIFNNYTLDVFKIPDLLTEQIKRHPNLQLTLLIQFERIVSPRRFALNDDERIIRPNGPFADVTVRLHNTLNDLDLQNAAYADYMALDKKVLASRSTWFRDRLMAIESNARRPPKETCLEITGVPARVFHSVLDYFYFNEFNIMGFDLTQALGMLKAAKKFRLLELEKPLLDRVCFLMHDRKSLLFDIYALALNENLIELRNVVLKLLNKHSGKVLVSDEWHEFSSARPDLLPDLLRGVMLSTEDTSSL